MGLERNSYRLMREPDAMFVVWGPPCEASWDFRKPVVGDKELGILPVALGARVQACVCCCKHGFPLAPLLLRPHGGPLLGVNVGT
ncbi:hypothetical protein MC885_019688 [Smutsia gigantea]|nr:hypothetical protein MC885_019688 [Smutsia gigantea]